jgi:hypothetical protein
MIKTFNIDWDDYEALSKLCRDFKSRLGELHASPKKEAFREVFDACNNIWNTNTSEHTKKRIVLDDDPIYYVYAHMDTSAGIRVKANPKTAFAATLGMNCIPFYIGKGTGDRAFDLNRNETHRKIRQRLNEYGREISVKILKGGLTELEAYSLEEKLIDIFGLKVYGGLLTNLDEGYLPSERRKLYGEQYSLMVPGYRKQKGSNPFQSTINTNR